MKISPALRRLFPDIVDEDTLVHALERYASSTVAEELAVLMRAAASVIAHPSCNPLYDFQQGEVWEVHGQRYIVATPARGKDDEPSVSLTHCHSGTPLVLTSAALQPGWALVAPDAARCAHRYYRDTRGVGDIDAWQCTRYAHHTGECCWVLRATTLDPGAHGKLNKLDDN